MLQEQAIQKIVIMDTASIAAFQIAEPVPQGGFGQFADPFVSKIAMMEPPPITGFLISETVSPGTGGGGESFVDVLASEDLPAFVAATSDGQRANSGNILQWGKVVGVTQEAVSSGFIAHLVDDDELTNPLWSWSPGQLIFLNGNVLSGTAPSSGWSQQIAIARNNQIIIVKLGEPILI